MTYILSQIFVCLSYAFMCLTYFIKQRHAILGFSMMANVLNGMGFMFLSAWSGVAMCGYAVLRNIIFLIKDRKNESENIKPIDYVILGVFAILAIIISIFTFDGVGSLLSVFATLIYTISVWQKNNTVYKILGIFSSVLWISYGIYVKSIFSIILEFVLLVSAILGILKQKYNIKMAVKLQNTQ